MILEHLYVYIWFVNMQRRILATLIALVVLPMNPAAAAMELLMFEQRGCIYCARWDEEIFPAYPNTAEGQAAPLHRLELHADLPAGISLVSPPRFTPTFVLVVDGVESGRIEGYPGENFFWPLLDELLGKADKNDLD